LLCINQNAIAYLLYLISNNLNLLIMSAITVTVILKDSTSNPPKIKLKDSEGHDPGNDDITTSVDAGDTVTWIPDLASGISSLQGIRKKVVANNNNLLASVTEDNGNYSGTIVSPSPGKNKKEQYEIGFKIAGDTNTYWDDPKLKMKN